MLVYPITVALDTNNAWLIGFVDFPEANSVSDSGVAIAMLDAADALETVIEMYIESGRRVPYPSDIEIADKITISKELYERIQEHNISNGSEVSSSKNKICLCMIVKNESKVIKRCLDSVMPIITAYCIVDTGSTDGTQK